MKLTMMVLALALAVAVPMVAQSSQPSQANPSMAQPPDQNSNQPMQQPDQSTSPMQQPDTSQPAQMPPGQTSGSSVSGTNPQASQTLSGTISADGKTLNCNGTNYNISNPNSVKPFANQPVTVAYEMDTNNSIRITKVMLTHPRQ